MYWVYILKSQINNYLYVGSTNNINRRLAQHNAGRVRSTKAYRPWTLLKTESYPSREEVVAREKFLKTGQQKERLRKEFGLKAW